MVVSRRRKRPSPEPDLVQSGAVLWDAAQSSWTPHFDGGRFELRPASLWGRIGAAVALNLSMFGMAHAGAASGSPLPHANPNDTPFQISLNASFDQPSPPPPSDEPVDDSATRIRPLLTLQPPERRDDFSTDQANQWRNRQQPPAHPRQHQKRHHGVKAQPTPPEGAPEHKPS